MRQRIRRVLLRPLDLRLERLQREVRNAQAMAARAYEATKNWPKLLEEIRSAPDYESPYDESEPLVTVRVATYNRSDKLIGRALASVLGQTYRNWEAVVVGDACTDDTEERVASIGDDRIKFVNLPFHGPYPDEPTERWRVAGGTR